MNHKHAAFAAAAIACLIAAQAPAQPAPTLAPSLEAWGQVMATTPLPKKGCFRASHPSPGWVEVPCVTVPLIPFLSPKAAEAVRGAALPSGFVVGSGGDFSAVVSGTISKAVGSFPTVTGLTSENDNGKANSYSLQLNANTFVTSLCSGAVVPGNCRGWQQFVYSTSGFVFMQYWLINFGNKCPAGFTPSTGNCFKNSTSPSASGQPITNLAKLSLTGTASSTTDTVVFSTGSGTITASGQDNVLGLRPNWNTAEFNIFGDGNGTQATFNKGATIAVRLRVTNGTTASPACSNNGFTAETSNLNLVSGSCCPSGGSSPAIRFTQTSATGVKAPFCLLNDLIPIQGPLL
jgi:hypothetical protein